LNKKIKSALQYAAMLAITAFLLWLALRSLAGTGDHNQWDIIWSAWQRADKFYLMLMMVAVMISHVLRAERWKMLMIPAGFRITLPNSFLSLMVGYLVNLAIPRGGELSRCYNLYKLEKTPIETSFGTVVVERMVDLVCLAVLVFISFVVEWNKLMAFMQSLNISSESKFNPILWIFALGAALMILMAAFLLIRKNEKIKKLWSGFRSGLLTIFQLKNKSLFIFYSVAIWSLYFVMSYLVLRAFEETAYLGMSAVLTLFAIGSIAMAVPLPGGAGSYHTLVPLGLVMLYQVPQTDAIAFVFIFHGWQTFIMIVGGLISLVISYGIIRWKQPPTK
jgi:uncharacterized protein (TIRG00374 family)